MSGVNCDARTVLYAPVTSKIHCKCISECICDLLTPTEIYLLKIYPLGVFNTYVMFSVGRV
jgi:hypothetical protein